MIVIMDMQKFRVFYTKEMLKQSIQFQIDQFIVDIDQLDQKNLL